MNALHLKLLTKPVSRPARIEETYRDTLVTEGMPPGTAFSVALPRGWVLDRAQRVFPPGPANPLVELARFIPAHEGALGRSAGAELFVWGAFLPREMHGRDWLRAWMASQGYEPLDFREAATPFGIMGDALALRRQGTGPRLHRLSTVKDGDLVFLLDGRAAFAPEMDHAAIQEIFLMALICFRLQQATGQFYAEGFQPVELSGTRAVRFQVSGLWRQRPGGDAPAGGASLVFDNLRDGSPIGTLIAVLGGPGTAASELEAVTLQKLNTMGIGFTAQTQPQYEDISPNWEIVVRSASALREGAPLTVVSARLTLGGMPLSLVLISPPESAAFEIWAVNLRAFDIALESLEIK